MRILAAWLALGMLAAGAWAEPSYPRLFGMQIGEKHYDDPEYQKAIARLDIAILGFYRGWGDKPDAVREVVRTLKRMNPELLVGQYTILNEASGKADNTAEHDKQTVLRKNRWWLTDAAGRRKQWTDAYGAWDINITAWTRPDRFGRRYPEWLAERDHRVYFGPVPEFDVWYFDNVMERQRIAAADWRQRGADQSGADPDVQKAFRRAQASHWQAARKLAPGVLLIGNPDNDLSLPEYRGRLQGAFLEALMGEPWSLAERAGWRAAMQRYHAVFDNLAPPRIVAFHVIGDARDMRFLRFALASALMNDGYFSFTERGRGYSSVAWFDEYDADLGRPLDPPQLEPWKDEVYRRRFQRGMVLLNPSDETKRITVPAGYRHLRGRQDPRVNTGCPATRVTLGPRDAVLLLAYDRRAAEPSLSLPE